MRHQHRELRVLHDVAGGAAENHLLQPAPGEGSLDQEVGTFRLGRREDGFTRAAASQFNAHRLGGDAVIAQLLAYLVG
jgi:hypothetical protein